MWSREHQTGDDAEALVGLTTKLYARAEAESGRTWYGWPGEMDLSISKKGSMYDALKGPIPAVTL